MSNSNTNEAISSISLYGRPSESFLFSLLDETSQENMSSELINMIQSRMNINLDTNSNNTNNHENHENQN